MRTRLHRRHHIRLRRSGVRSRPLALCQDELSVIVEHRRSELAEIVNASAAS